MAQSFQLRLIICCLYRSLKALAKACSGNVAMFNSTVFGAFLEDGSTFP